MAFDLQPHAFDENLNTLFCHRTRGFVSQHTHVQTLSHSQLCQEVFEASRNKSQARDTPKHKTNRGKTTINHKKSKFSPSHGELFPDQWKKLLETSQKNCKSPENCNPCDEKNRKPPQNRNAVLCCFLGKLADGFLAFFIDLSSLRDVLRDNLPNPDGV